MYSTVIIAGGTGGHVFPALSLALHLQDQGASVIFLTDRRGMTYVKSFQERLHPVVLPLDHKAAGLWGLVRLCFQGIHCFILSLQYMHGAKRVIGFSGFPTFATLLAGVVCGKPVFIHEQNAVLGRVNRWLAPFIKKIFISTQRLQKVPANAERKLDFVGMPVRADIAALNDEPYMMPTQEGSFSLLVTGGSQGAQSFAQVIPEAIALLPKAQQKRLHILHQVRSEDHERAQKLYQKSSVGQVTLVPFIEDMAAALKSCHLAIARAGASTLAEFCAAGRPSILVPYPFATDDHQFFNAQEIVRVGGGWSLEHRDFTPASLAALLLDLLTHPKKLLVASQLVKVGYEKNSINTLAQRALVV